MIWFEGVLTSSTKNTNLEFGGNKARLFQVSNVFNEPIPPLGKFVNKMSVFYELENIFKSR